MAADRLTGRRLYLCTPDRPDLEAFVDACVRGGVDVVQLREKDLAAKALVERARLLATACDGLGVPFIVNDRPDIALEVEAHGVHVGQDDVSPALARRLLGPDKIVGLSTHGIDDLRGSLDEPVDYISAGPVVPTPTKPGRPGTGLDYATLAVTTNASRARQVFVTGGVSPDTVPAMVRAGIEHFVVVRYLTEAEEPFEAARRLRGVIDAALAARHPI
ncbi:MAG: thiamine phosphate synthase [Acidimicrobiales bacterium]